MQKKIFLLLLAILYSHSINSEVLPNYPAEVVGRDLAQFGFGWLGHIAVTIGSDMDEVSDHVIEVMNSTPAIQINTLEDFKSRTFYWGSKYGIAERNNKAMRIISEANFQRGLCPIYTTTAAFEPGAGYGIDGLPTKCAVFRCDTFVNYVFHKAGYDLPTYNGVTMPRMVFNSFPKGHGDGPLAPEEKSNSALASHSPFALKLNNLNLSQVESMSLPEFMKLIDQPAKNLSKSDLEILWQWAKSKSLIIEKRIILIDYLGLVSTVDFIPKFIEEYEQPNDAALKSMLLRSTLTLHQKYNWLKNKPEEKRKLQSFYSSIINNKLSAEDTEISLRGFIDLSSEEEVAAKINKIESILENDNINPAINVGLWIELIMKSKRLEQRSVPKILNRLHHENNPHLDDLFNQFIVHRLSKLGLNALTPESKNQIRSYLDSIAYRYSSTVKNIGMAVNLPYYGSWLEATALLNSDSLSDARNYINHFLSKKTNKEKSSYLNGLSNYRSLKEE